MADFGQNRLWPTYGVRLCFWLVSVCVVCVLCVGCGPDFRGGGRLVVGGWCLVAWLLVGPPLPRTTPPPDRPSPGQPLSRKSKGPPLPRTTPPPDRPKFRAFFPSPVRNFTLSSLSGGLLVGFWWFFEGRDRQMYTSGLSGCCEPPAASRSRGLHTTIREFQTCTFAPALEDPQREKKE